MEWCIDRELPGFAQNELLFLICFSWCCSKYPFLTAWLNLLEFFASNPPKVECINENCDVSVLWIGIVGLAWSLSRFIYTRHTEKNSAFLHGSSSLACQNLGNGGFDNLFSVARCVPCVSLNRATISSVWLQICLTIVDNCLLYRIQISTTVS